MAWLHSAPKLHDKDAKPRSRMASLPDGHPSKRLPEADSYLSMCFSLSGMCLSGAMGPTPLTWSELDRFSSRSGYDLDGWQSEQIIMMSRDYCYMLSKAGEIGYPAPYQEGAMNEDQKQEMRDRVAKQWESFSDNVKVK